MNLDRRLFNQIIHARALFSLAVAAGFLAGIAAVLQARQLSSVIARVHLEGAGLAQVLPLLQAFLVYLLVRAVAGFASETAAGLAAARIKDDLRNRLAGHILALGPAYAQGERSGELLNSAAQGIEALDAYFSQYLPQLALAGLLPAAYLVVVFPVDPLSGAVLLFTGPLIPFFMFLIGQNAKTLTQRQWTALERMSTYFLDTLQGLATLKALGRSRDQAGRIAQVSERYRDTTLSVLRVTFLSALALELLGTIGTAIISVQIGLRLLYGQVGFEQALFVLLLAPDFYLPLRGLGLRFHASMAGVSAARRIFEVLEQPVPQNSPAQPVHQVVSLREPFEIVVQDVSFTYPERSQPALDGASLCIRSGEVTALAGASGAGKSTLAQLLLRFLRPDRGGIQVNGVQLDRMPVEDWRAQIAWVPQQAYLFHGTIASNLRIARPNAGIEELERAAGQAYLLEWISSLPDGFDTRVGEGGARLSAGQAQRLALARAFLRDAPFLVLDEPTAHLDIEQEELLQRATRELCRGRTALIIAHRLPTLLAADRVAVLAGGRVVEAGEPGRLLKQAGPLARLAAAYTGQEGSI